MYIETERLILRPFEMSDADELFEMESLAEVHTYLGKNPAKSLDDVIKNINWNHEQLKENGIARSVVFLKEANKVIGWSGLKLEKEVRPFHYYDIGYRFHPAYWGKGIATESAIASIKYGFEQLDLPKICGAAETENLASNRVLEKIGLKKGELFTFDGAECKWYALEKEEFMSLQR